MATVKQHKPGTPVTITRRNGETLAGKVVTTEDKRNGRWITVRTGDKKNSVDYTVRDSQVVKR